MCRIGVQIERETRKEKIRHTAAESIRGVEEMGREGQGWEGQQGESEVFYIYVTARHIILYFTVLVGLYAAFCTSSVALCYWQKHERRAFLDGLDVRFLYALICVKVCS